MTFAPRFGPGGQQASSCRSSEGASTNLYTMNLGSNGRSPNRLTDTQAIDTSPSYAPDGSKHRASSPISGGTQQIYVMARGRRRRPGASRLATDDTRRRSGRPRATYIAFTKQGKGGFGIGVMKPDGSGERILTEGFHNEGPTWAPNGLFLMFFRDPGGGGGSHIHMTDVFGRSGVRRCRRRATRAIRHGARCWGGEGRLSTAVRSPHL